MAPRRCGNGVPAGRKHAAGGTPRYERPNANSKTELMPSLQEKPTFQGDDP